MKKLIIFLILSLAWLPSAQAELTIEITKGMKGALPIAVVPFGWQGPGAPPVDLAAVINADLQRSGRFETKPRADIVALARPTTPEEIEFKDWRALNADNLVVGQVRPQGTGGYEISFYLFGVYQGAQLLGYPSISTTAPNLRATAHRIADLIYEKLMGEKGAFGTNIAYITTLKLPDGGKKIVLYRADADGYDAKDIVTSSDPLMSPAWSPDGSKIAYVSFEGGQSAIYVQQISTGQRQKVTGYKGINSAPAWSPDGRKLAMTLSKGGNPDIYIFDLQTRRLQPVTRHYAIDTEPAWSPDGRYLVFTSDRGGQPQIYRVPAFGGEVERVTFQNSYNARASYSPDGKLLALVTRENGNYRIAVQDLESGVMQVLSQGRLDESPSFAPNGSMIIYASKEGNRNVLAAVSVDGRVHQRLAEQEGDVREPVWSPFKN
jgi:TolB protein